MEKLAGKVAVITGGSSGIGLATAKRFVEEGAHVFITGRRQAELDRVQAELGHHVTTVQGDVANLGDLDRLYQVVAQQKGVLHVAVANAAFAEPATLVSATPEHFDRTFAVNARGTFFTVQKALPLMTQGGAVVTVCTAGQVRGIPTYVASLGAKATIRSFVRSWAAELGGRGIRVNNLSPGGVDTPLFRGVFNTREAVDGVVARTPLARIGRPEELAAAILYLTCEDSSFCTGSDLFADGGFTQV